VYANEGGTVKAGDLIHLRRDTCVLASAGLPANDAGMLNFWR
jgi:hypothetical protein